MALASGGIVGGVVREAQETAAQALVQEQDGVSHRLLDDGEMLRSLGEAGLDHIEAARLLDDGAPLEQDLELAPHRLARDAGGFGDRIAQGLALNNNELLLAGAIPAASLALLLQFLFEKLNKKRF